MQAGMRDCVDAKKVIRARTVSGVTTRRADESTISFAYTKDAFSCTTLTFTSFGVRSIAGDLRGL